MTDQQITNDLLADLIREQQKTRLAVTQLAEALSGVRREVMAEETATTEPTPKPEQAQPEQAQPETVEQPADKPSEPEPTPEPEPEEDEKVTLADLRKTFAAQSKAGKKEELKDMLFNKFGAVKLTEVNAENYAELKKEALAL